MHKICNWMVFNQKINSKDFGPICSLKRLSSKNAKQYTYCCLNLAGKTVLQMQHCNGEFQVDDPFSTEIYRKYYLILNCKYILLRRSHVQQYRPLQTERRELCNIYGEFCRLRKRTPKVLSYFFNSDVHREHSRE